MAYAIDPDMVGDLLAGPIYFRFVHGTPMHPGLGEEPVDTLLAGVASDR